MAPACASASFRPPIRTRRGDGGQKAMPQESREHRATRGMPTSSRLSAMISVPGLSRPVRAVPRPVSQRGLDAEMERIRILLGSNRVELGPAGPAGSDRVEVGPCGLDESEYDPEEAFDYREDDSGSDEEYAFSGEDLREVGASSEEEEKEEQEEAEEQAASAHALWVRRFRCGDPDFLHGDWAPHGLLLGLYVPEGYSNSEDRQPDACWPRLMAVDLDGGADPADTDETDTESIPPFVREMLPRLFDEFLEKNPGEPHPIYRGLQYLDRHLVQLWRIALVRRKAEVEKAVGLRTERAADNNGPEPGRGKKVAGVGKDGEEKSASRQNADEDEEAALEAQAGGEWTMDEQRSLEEALAMLRAETDVREKWRAVARHVTGRTPKECAARFKLVRLRIMRRANLKTAELEWNIDELRRVGESIAFDMDGTRLDGVATLIAAVLRIQVACHRCRKPSSLTLASSYEGGCSPDKADEATKAAAQPRSAAADCSVCSQPLELRFAPAVAHGWDLGIGFLQGRNCQPVDVLPSDFLVSCEGCTLPTLARGLKAGYKKRSNCTGCHTSMNLCLGSVHIDGGDGLRTAQEAVARYEERVREGQARAVAARERRLGGPDNAPIRIGTPLHMEGACKHYRKSNRWLRFPCCGKAFACGECHDAASDHQFDWATRMLCGFCSREMPYVKDGACSCGKRLTRDRTQFWEGGQGCRDKTKMSSKDPHKYKGLGKTESRRARVKA